MRTAPLRPVGLAVIVAVAASAFGAGPRPGLHGDGLGVTLAIVAFAAMLRVAVAEAFSSRAELGQMAVILLAGAAGVALMALQPRGAAELAGGAAVWMAVARLPLRRGIAVALAIAAALDVAAALGGSSVSAVLAITFLSALLALVSYTVRQARENEERSARAAALEERSRMAGELHDVLAHALSAAAIQLQGARKLAESEQAAAELRGAIDRAAELVRDGLANARDAVGALRGDLIPGVDDLGDLIGTFRRDANVDVAFSVTGTPRGLEKETGLAVYRGAQEALTNSARYAPGAPVRVTLSYDDTRTTLRVENEVPAPGAVPLAGVGGGRGLAGLRERVERVGGTLTAGPAAGGWSVELEVPA